MAPRSTFRDSVRSLLREQLLDAASDALLAGGWNKLKMADIANAVGVSRQTVYNEFGNKTGLGEALALREAERFLDGVSSRLDEHPDDVLVAIHAAVESVVRLVVSHLVMPLASADEVASQIAWLATRIIDLPARQDISNL